MASLNNMATHVLERKDVVNHTLLNTAKSVGSFLPLFIPWRNEAGSQPVALWSIQAGTSSCIWKAKSKLETSLCHLLHLGIF
mmetsp:Transcript_45202/g.80867  ORF Transcript_45202/g.80867 Transcript_45202/m.80867 type:complete len:82 (+) Transcript_45202:973-1218(+)